MKFRYPKNSEFEMLSKQYYFEHTTYYRVDPLERKLLNDKDDFPAWMKANACDAFVTDDGNGICCLTPNSDGSKYVYAIWVNQQCRGRGYGEAMLEHAKTLSPKGLALHVNVQNPTALCLYYKCGFRFSAKEGACSDGFFWRVYMETKPGLKGKEKDTEKYEFPPKEMKHLL